MTQTFAKYDPQTTWYKFCGPTTDLLRKKMEMVWDLASNNRLDNFIFWIFKLTENGYKERRYTFISPLFINK